MPQWIIRCLSFMSFNRVPNHSGVGPSRVALFCFSWPKVGSQKRKLDKWETDQVHFLYFFQEVISCPCSSCILKVQGCIGCGMPKSKSKDFGLNNSSMISEDPSFADGLHVRWVPPSIHMEHISTLQDGPLPAIIRVMVTINGLINGKLGL